MLLVFDLKNKINKNSIMVLEDQNY